MPHSKFSSIVTTFLNEKSSFLHVRLFTKNVSSNIVYLGSYFFFLQQCKKMGIFIKELHIVFFLYGNKPSWEKLFVVILKLILQAGLKSLKIKYRAIMPKICHFRANFIPTKLNAFFCITESCLNYKVYPLHRNGQNFWVVQYVIRMEN